MCWSDTALKQRRQRDNYNAESVKSITGFQKILHKIEKYSLYALNDFAVYVDHICKLISWRFPFV